MGPLRLAQRTAADDLTIIALSCMVFTLSYFFVRKYVFPGRPAMFSNTMVSLMHAALMLPLSASAIEFRQKWKDFGTPTTGLQELCLSATYGYFIYDTIGVYLISHDWSNTVHHVASLLAFTIGIFQGISGSELCWSLFLMEISNPLLHLRAFFKETGRTESSLAKVTEVLFVLSFLVCRILVGPALAYKVLTCPTSSIVIKAGGAGVQLMSFYWGYIIVKVAFQLKEASANGHQKDHR